MRQDGYVLLLTLFAIVGVSSAWLSSAQPNIKNYSAEQTIEIESARQALISYAVNYSDHYGVQGAGIGHLPCPDTDAPNAVAIDPWVRDGPNPPCSRHQIESGWLPRHVNTERGRYHFHTRQRQRLLYAVSGRFINNPINRVVNPASRGDIQIGRFSDVIAVVGVPKLDKEHAVFDSWWKTTGSNSALQAFAVVRSSDMALPMMRRAAAWLLARLHDSRRPSNCALSAELELLHWLSVEEIPTDCVEHARRLQSEFALLEGAPYARHWFIRNRWYDYIDFDIAKACSVSADTPCEFVITPVSRRHDRITLTLQQRKVSKES